MQALIEEIIHEAAENDYRQIPSVNSIFDCFDAIRGFALQNRRAIMHIYRSVSRELFERQLISICEYFVCTYAETVLKKDRLSEKNKQTAVDYYKALCLGLVLSYLDNGISDDYARSVRRLFLPKVDPVQQFAESIGRHM